MFSGTASLVHWAARSARHSEHSLALRLTNVGLQDSFANRSLFGMGSYRLQIKKQIATSHTQSLTSHTQLSLAAC